MFILWNLCLLFIWLFMCHIGDQFQITKNQYHCDECGICRWDSLSLLSFAIRICSYRTIANKHIIILLSASNYLLWIFFWNLISTVICLTELEARIISSIVKLVVSETKPNFFPITSLFLSFLMILCNSLSNKFFNCCFRMLLLKGNEG